jgi:glycosyl transferase family 87
VLASLLVACGAFRAWRAAQRAPGIDFYHYWVVGHVVGRGDIPSVYEDDSRAALGQEFLRRALAEGSGRQQAVARVRQVLEPTSTPFLYATLSPFARADYDASLDTYLAFSLASLLAALFVFGRLVGQGRLDRLLLMALVLYAFQPVQADLRVGNVSQLQLALLALYAWLGTGMGKARQIAAGAVLGAAIAFKPSVAVIAPALFAWWALARSRRRILLQAAGLAGGGLFAVLLGGLWFGSLHAWGDWLAAVRRAGLAAMPIEFGNVSALAVAERGLGVSPGALPAVATSLAVLAAMWIRRRSMRMARPAERNAAAVEDLLLIAAACLVVLLSSPLVWQHYLILALPSVVVLLRPEARWPWPAMAAFVAIAIDPWADLFGVADPVRQAPLVVAGLVVLFVLVLIEIAGGHKHAERQVET